MHAYIERGIYTYVMHVYICVYVYTYVCMYVRRPVDMLPCVCIYSVYASLYIYMHI